MGTQGVDGGKAQPDPLPCVYEVNSVVLIVMGGVSILCVLFVLSMCLHVQEMRLKYKSAMSSLEEGDPNDEDDDDDEKDDEEDDNDDDDAKKSLKEKRKAKKRDKKRRGFFVRVGNGPQHLGIKK